MTYVYHKNSAKYTAKGFSVYSCQEVQHVQIFWKIVELGRHEKNSHLIE